MKICVESLALSNYRVRAAIKFLKGEGVTGLKIHRRLSKVCGAPYPQSKT